MISLINVTRFHGPPKAPRFILNDVSIRFENRERIGILAPSGSGKSTIARIIAGKERPNMGQVISKGQMSWPLGFAAAFHPALSSAQNTSMVAKLWNMDPYDLVTRVEDFAELGSAFYQPISELAPGQRLKTALALSLSTTFDSYLADDMNVSNASAFRAKCDAALQDRLASAGLIMLSRHARLLDQFAKRFFVLAEASLIECDSATQAQDILNLLSNEEHAPYAIA